MKYANRLERLSTGIGRLAEMERVLLICAAVLIAGGCVIAGLWLDAREAQREQDRLDAVERAKQSYYGD
jgi:hypothetical protein